MTLTIIVLCNFTSAQSSNHNSRCIYSYIYSKSIYSSYPGRFSSIKTLHHCFASLSAIPVGPVQPFLLCFSQEQRFRSSQHLFSVESNIPLSLCRADGQRRKRRKRELSGKITYSEWIGGFNISHKLSMNWVCANVI